MDIQKVILILIIVFLCLALVLMNFYSFSDQYYRGDQTENSNNIKHHKSKLSMSTSPHSQKKTTKKSTIVKNGNSDNNHHHVFHAVNESDLFKNHFGEGSYDHGETQSLTKHEVQTFLLKYFGLLQSISTEQREEEEFFDDTAAASSDENEEIRNKKAKILNERFCKSRQAMLWKELRRFASPALLKALENQKRRHEAVASGKPFKNQKYLIWSLSGGLGNRFQSIVSCFVAAVLSNRVFLMKDWFMPLPHSSVKQTPIIISSPNTDHYMLENLAKVLRVEDNRPMNDELLCPLLPMMSLREFVEMYPEEFFETNDEKEKFKNAETKDEKKRVLNDLLATKPKFFSHPQHVKVDIAHRHDKTLRRWNRMLCSNMSEEIVMESDTQTHSDLFSASTSKNNKKKFSKPNSPMPNEAKFFFPEKFVYIWTNQYFLPGFFANPFMATQMRDMFPDNNPYSVLVRAIVMPSLPVVRSVRKFFEQNADLSLLHPLDYVGLQIRAFRDREILELGKYFEFCFEKFYGNGKNKKNNNYKKKKSSDDDDANHNTNEPFFLATLHEAVRQHFAKKFGTGRVVTLAPARHEQKTGIAHFDQEALTDMFLLAFSKDLFVSPGSTFGSFVAAYAQTHPRVVSFDREKLTATCSRAKFLEPCFASLIWYDKLMGGRGEAKLSCKLEKVPDGASGCVV